VPEPINPNHIIAHFDCGKPALNTWLKTRALSNHQKGFTAVLVVHEQLRVLGYYGLAPTSALPSIFPRSIRTGQPPTLVPCLLLGQLAVDASSAGQGLGSSLLRHALSRSVDAARLIGGRALLVSAIDAEAQIFWKRRGFLETHDDPMLLFRSMADVAASLEALTGH
jgi:GNAT superfamily N-acetyltransferase